ncbi:NUDIX hydrolase [Thermotalea metallivorans]|uniref:Nudix hydrolase domain-containing protein n=1 Tax=Thermotalea metallivorans TaxID=520762 RepID=A0A140L782_9FIRM|nr:CoA pyrophosphatase [Thermotalea metallivorans]KXG76407.1 hypothetical protein AN619_09380 [Thermotalea metallivorans]
MELHAIKTIVQSRTAKPEGKYNRFSVLVPILQVQGELHLLFEIRSEKLKNQPGEICFPGGRIEKNESPEQCAVRETSEELNLPTEKIQIFGPLDYIVTPFNAILYPFLGFLPGIRVEQIHFNRDEVGDVFTVPMKFFLTNNPEEHFINIKAALHDDFPFHMIQNGRNYKWKVGKYPELFYQYNGHIIWGMTARIVKNFINIIKGEEDL